MFFISFSDIFWDFFFLTLAILPNTAWVAIRWLVLTLTPGVGVRSCKLRTWSPVTAPTSDTSLVPGYLYFSSSGPVGVPQPYQV